MEWPNTDFDKRGLTWSWKWKKLLGIIFIWVTHFVGNKLEQQVLNEFACESRLGYKKSSWLKEKYFE